MTPINYSVLISFTFSQNINKIRLLCIEFSLFNVFQVILALVMEKERFSANISYRRTQLWKKQRGQGCPSLQSSVVSQMTQIKSDGVTVMRG